MKYAWIKANRDSFPLALMCRVLGVSKSGYYDALDRQPSPRAMRSIKLRQSIKQVYVQSYQAYGSYKIAQQLKQDNTVESACRNTVAKAMREMGLKSRVARKFNPTTTVTDPSKQPAPNLLDQVFTASAPNQKWVADITYLPIQGAWVYLAVVLDIFSRKVVGWSISESLATAVVSDALRNAIENRRPRADELLHHSDRGCQYTSDEYQRTLRSLGITCSMSRTGCCYDNAVMERFFWSLKHEWTKFESFSDLNQARISVFRYIETFYNTARLHQTLGYKTPTQFETEYDLNLAT